MSSIDDLFLVASPVEPVRVQALRVSLGLDECRYTPFAHQVIGIKKLIDDPYVGLFDEPGAGKTLQVIVAAQLLFRAGTIDRVIVIAPADVRPVWYDPYLGELAAHLFPAIPAQVSEYHAKIRQWKHGNWAGTARQLRIIVSNYQFLRNKLRVSKLFSYCGPKTLLVLDESSLVKNMQSAQSKAVAQLRKRCGRVVLMNGTPYGDTPIDLMNQANLLHPGILECRWLTQFRTRYAIMETYRGFPEVKNWVNLDDLQRRFAPYVLRRLKKDCLDLPEALPPVLREVTLKPTTWTAYKSMRDDMVTMLRENVGTLAPQAITKALRLAQITSGFVGGIEEIIKNDEVEFGESPEWVAAAGGETRHLTVQPVQAIGREKLDWVLEFFTERLAAEPDFKLLVWCRFRPELFRMLRAVLELFPQIPDENINYLAGGQKRAEREAALRLLHPSTAPDGPVFLVATYGTGSMGHNFSACHTVVNCSYDYALLKAQQAEARVDRPGQTHVISYYDIVAVGPAGQKTIDTDIVKAKRTKQSMAEWTTSAWVRALEEE